MLKGKVAVVTGGTRGIGFAIVKKYLENGATVVLCGSRQETADKAVQELKEINTNFKVEGIGLDLNNPEEIAKEFNRIKDQYGSIDILVNNAGISQRESIYDLKPENFDNILELNVNAMFYCSQAAVKIMKPQGGGTAQPNQLPFFVAACDYTLIGEELFAASAYLSRDPLQVGSLRGQDVGKAIVMILLLVCSVLYTMGIDWAKLSQWTGWSLT